MSDDRETIALPGGWQVEFAENPYIRNAHGRIVGRFLEEKFGRAFAAALHHTTDEKATSRAPVGLVDGEPSRDLVANAIHDARWPNDGRSTVPYTHLAESGKSDNEYAYRLADGVLRVLASSTQPDGQSDLVAYIKRQWAWSKETFGPALRTKGVIEHIRKELREIEVQPHDLSEWVDVIILAMDGFWRHGGQPEDLLPRMQAKQDKNFARQWPDWRTMSEDSAIEHDRSGEAAPKAATQAGDASGGVDVALKEVERVCRIIEPNLFSDDPATAHREASPYKVEYARKLIHDKVAEIARALSPQSAPLGREDAGANFCVHPDARKSHPLRDTIFMALADIQKRRTRYQFLTGRTADDLGEIADAISLALAPQPPTDKAGAAVGGRDAIALERHIDEIDAARFASSWLEQTAQSLPRQALDEITEERSDVHLRVFWRNRRPFAAALTFRDQMNYAYGARLMFEASPHPDDGSVKGQDQGGGRG